MARAKITGVFKFSDARKVYVIFCNRDIFDDGWLGDKSMHLLTAVDELDAFKQGMEYVDDWNERDKAQRKADRDKAKTDKGK